MKNINEYLALEANRFILRELKIYDTKAIYNCLSEIVVIVNLES